MNPLLGVVALHDERSNPYLGVNEPVFNQLLDHFSGGVADHTELGLQLGEARDGVSWLVDAGFDAVSEFVVHLFPDSTITLPDDLPVYLFDHGAEGSGPCSVLAAHALAQQGVTWHDLAWHTRDHGPCVTAPAVTP